MNSVYVRYVNELSLSIIYNSDLVNFSDFEKTIRTQTYLVGGFKHTKKKKVMRCKLSIRDVSYE